MHTLLGLRVLITEQSCPKGMLTGATHGILNLPVVSRIEDVKLINNLTHLITYRPNVQDTTLSLKLQCAFYTDRCLNSD